MLETGRCLIHNVSEIDKIGVMKIYHDENVWRFLGIVAETKKANSASYELLIKLGFKREKRLIRFNEEQIIFYINQQ